MSVLTCIACQERLPAAHTTVRRADGTVRFVMCNACFENRLCTTCLVYFPNAQGRKEHRCPS